MPGFMLLSIGNETPRVMTQKVTTTTRLQMAVTGDEMTLTRVLMRTA